jgi:serine/threonine protein kinase
MKISRLTSRTIAVHRVAALLLALAVGATCWIPSPAIAQDAGKASAKSTSKSSAMSRRTKDNLIMAAEIGGGALGLIVLIFLIRYLKNRPEKEEAPPQVDNIPGYRLQNMMMSGQTSQVWEVVENASGRHFAMKLLLPEKLKDSECRDLLYHEAEVGIKMAHPNIIKIVKLEKDKKNPYFVMEFFPAGNLKLRIMHKKWDFIKEKAQDIFKQTATALAYMNASGWVHRDVKPDNIMVNSAGEVRLIDFALAQRVSAGGMLSRKTQAAGTRSYMSPEQIRGLPLDGRADIYSFGATVYEVVTGRPPFRAASPQDLLAKHFTEKPSSPQMYNPDVTEEFSDLVLRMLAKKKEDRPKDFHEVLMKLRTIRVFKGESAKKTTAEAENA